MKLSDQLKIAKEDITKWKNLAQVAMESQKILLEQYDDFNNDVNNTKELYTQSEQYIEKLEKVIDGFCEAVEAADRYHNKPKGGQQVPFHGDFANAPPSVMIRLKWWAKAFTEVMKSNR